MFLLCLYDLYDLLGSIVFIFMPIGGYKCSFGALFVSLSYRWCLLFVADTFEQNIYDMI